jgi:23S rRNA (adenine2503-C2)-methyltransferase
MHARYRRLPPARRGFEAISLLVAVTSRFDLSRVDLGVLLDGEPAYRVDQVWTGLHAGAELAALTTLPKILRERLAGEPAFEAGLELVVESVGDRGQTVKSLWQLHDGTRIESVLMHNRGWSTVCISTQAGCAMACGFCATGQAGFDRNLSVGEIVEQVVRARVRALPHRLTNVVFMGMGEPLANYERTWGAVERLHDDLGLSARRLTVSTVGIVPGIRRLAGEKLPVNLAVSLHAADDELRNELVPINKRYPLDVLMAACRDYLDAKGRRLSFEWALIDGVNDRDVDADGLAALARSLRAHVNLIPLNGTPGYPTKGTPRARVVEFRDRLLAAGANATIRRTRGNDIDAACGQLRAAATTPIILSAGAPPARRLRH